MRFPKNLQARIIREIENYKSPKERAEFDLHEFVLQAWEHVDPAQFVDGWHIRAICLHLQACFKLTLPGDLVIEKLIKRLLINIPPGCMKSLLCNVFFPAWVWAQDPTQKFGFFSYGSNLTNRDAMKFRTLIESEWYKANWGDKFTLSGGIERITNDKGGWRLSSSISGQGTGEHPNFIVVDDPLKAGDANAESGLVREGVNNWWSGTMATRGVGINSCRILIMQRLHQMDLSGYVLSREDPPVHICLPMRAEKNRMKPTPLGWTDTRKEGELLWPDVYPEEKLLKLEAELGPWETPGQLQQRPTPAGGGVIKVDKITPILDALPSDCAKFVRYYDKAATLGTGDYTAGVLMTYSPSQQIVIVCHLLRGQWDWDARNRRMMQQAAIDCNNHGLLNVKIRGEQEGGSGGKESAGISARDLATYNVAFATVTGNKVDRAGPFAGQVNAGNVRLLKGDWNQAYLEELEVFPVGTHDDQVDASSGAYNILREWLDIKFTTDRSILMTLDNMTDRLAQLDRDEAQQNGHVTEPEPETQQTLAQKRMAAALSENPLLFQDDEDNG